MAAVAPDGFPDPGVRVALLGDTHANTGWAIRVVEDLAADGITAVVQLGDFGWWPQFRFAEKLSRAAARVGVDVLFLDGNHEHHAHLRAAVVRCDPAHDSVSPVRLRPRVWYLPRGCAWEWSGVRFRALGGAYSIDRQDRTLGKSWFAEEVPSAVESGRAAAAGPADVMLCHDYPALGYRLRGMELPADIERAARQVPDMLADVARAIRPQFAAHGHWHRRYSTAREGVAIEGLDCDNTARSVVILDLETVQARNWPAAVFRRRW